MLKVTPMNSIFRSPLSPLKRWCDAIMTTIVLLFLWPLLLAVSVLIYLEDRGPIFFIQERVGLNGKPFGMYKFRSMIVNAEAPGGCSNLVSEDQRITKIGKFIRRWSIDEMPQILNVLKGEMSIIGPRPTLAYQVEHYTEHQRKRLKAKPGITGWAQVNGRNRLTWDERIELDIEYIETYSLWLDLKILSRTLQAVADESGIYGHGWHPPAS